MLVPAEPVLANVKNHSQDAQSIGRTSTTDSQVHFRTLKYNKIEERVKESNSKMYHN